MIVHTTASPHLSSPLPSPPLPPAEASISTISRRQGRLVLTHELPCNASGECSLWLPGNPPVAKLPLCLIHFPAEENGV